MSASVKSTAQRWRARLGCVLPLASTATVALLATHEAARATIDALGGVEALMGPIDAALLVGVAFLALFAARLALLFALPGLVLFGIGDVSVARFASWRRARTSADEGDPDATPDR